MRSRALGFIVALGVLGACAGPGSGSGPGTDSGPTGDSAAARDGLAVPDAGDRLTVTRLEVLAPTTWARSGRTPVVVRAFAGDALALHASGTVPLAAEGGTVSVPQPLRLYRGGGSAGVVVAGDGGDVTLVATFEGVTARHTLRAHRGERRSFPPGAVLDADTALGPFADVLVPGDLRVPAGVTLTIREGTTVAIGGNLLVEGRLEVAGTPAAPVWFGPTGETWGGVAVGGEGAAFAWALLTGGGAEAARAFGHSDSQPVLFVEGGALTLDHVALLDSPGKALGARDARVTVEDSLVARCDTGGELESTHLRLQRSHILEIPDADGLAADDDNDGLYLVGPYPREGPPEPSLVTDAVFAVGEDDGLDHNGATVRIERCWFEDFRHEGIACSSGGRVEIADTLVRRCEQGIEAGYGAPEIVVRHSVATANDVGFRFGDSYDWPVEGTLTVIDSIAVANATANVRNHVNALAGPRDGALRIETSMVADPAWDGRDGNLPGTPLFDATWHLAPGSPGRGAASDGGDVGLR